MLLPAKQDAVIIGFRVIRPGGAVTVHPAVRRTTRGKTYVTRTQRTSPVLSRRIDFGSNLRRNIKKYCTMRFSVKSLKNSLQANRRERRLSDFERSDPVVRWTVHPAVRRKTRGKTRVTRTRTPPVVSRRINFCSS